MASKTASTKFRDVLDKLEAEYGRLVPSDDPVEAGVMTLLAEHAPEFATEEHRDALRDWFVDWNEARVADPWDISRAMGVKPGTGGRTFASSMVRFLSSLHAALNRCAFDRVLADPEADLEALLGKMRGAPPATRAVMRAALDAEGGWHVGREVAKLSHSLGFAPKTTSLTKVGKALSEVATAEDRMRAHYLLTRYATRGAEDPDPLASRGRARKSAAGAKTSSKKTSTKKTSAKTATSKAAASKSAKKKTTKSKTAKKKTAKKR